MEQQRKGLPWLKIVLAISLVLNLVFVGMIGSIATRAGADGSALRAALSALPREDRRVMRQNTRDIWRAARIGRQSGGAAQQMVDALRADEFDVVQFSEGLARAQEHLLRTGERMQANLVDRVTQMTQEERRTYADALESRIHARSARFGQTRD